MTGASELMYGAIRQHLLGQLEEIRSSGLYKSERILDTAQSPHIRTSDGRQVLNLCANNYLGLANHPAMVESAKQALDRWGFGVASVRFICGTQGIHKQLERRISEFLGMDDAILYSSCWDANGGVFETILGAEDAVISDELNHASIIDGVRLCKAQRFRYKNCDMVDLEARLQEASSARFKLIVTDGVFSMDGYLAPLPQICDLAEKYDALVMVDDSHAVGFLGRHGRGTPEYHGVMGRIDILTGTLGKALGGASGGYTAARREIVEILRQRSRPYLFSNSVAPAIVAASLTALELIEQSRDLIERLEDNTRFFREGIEKLGFEVLPGAHPIIPIMIGDAVKAVRLAEALLELGVYVIAFSYPVVPRGRARIRTQMCAAHTREDLEFALKAFAEARKLVG
ncbi:MAG: glycine C-acetyltransferase [Bryobacteraceae bacterium]|nr:glycine C-acetyltransferase [Bryobacteraceae bacterium]MDW8377959.1 glycine C-acetyltransferase [Bryobacterales bacterium]